MTQRIARNLLLVLLFLATAVHAQKERRLTAKVFTLGDRLRTASPCVIDVTFDWEGKKLLTGEVEITVREGSSIVGRIRTGELALTPGRQTFRWSLPPLVRRSDASVIGQLPGDGAVVHLQFFSATSVVDLKSHKLRVQSHRMRAQLIAIGTRTRGIDRNLEQVAASLRLEKLLPLDPRGSNDHTGAATLRSSSLTTDSVSLAAQDFPTSPLLLCAMDIVLVGTPCLARLKQKQLTALADWVEAGGSLCILLSKETRLRPAPAKMLWRLVGMAVDAQGKPALDPKRGAGISTHRAELGRVVAVHRPLRLPADLASGEWRRAAGFLWKMRARLLRSLAAKDGWRRLGPIMERSLDRSEEEDDTDEADPLMSDDLFYYGLGPVRLPRVVERILPAEIRPIPLDLLFGLLVVFVLVIGPVEYGLARAVRRGWLTWIVFPTVCIGFTLATVSLARHYLGQSDERRAVVVVDVGKNGRELRRTRLELVFLAEGRTETRDFSNALCRPLQSKRFFDIEGAYPRRYSRRQALVKWTPQANRTTTIGPGEKPPPVNWAAVEMARAGRSVGPPTVTSRPSEVRVFRGNGEKVVATSLGLAQRPVSVELLEDLRRLHAPPVRGFFSAVSQVSPTGGPSLEDLAVHDPSDISQVLVTVTTVEGDDIVVYRRLYREGQ